MSQLGVLDQRLLVVVGAGGVGKTTLAASMGLVSAAEGARTPSATRSRTRASGTSRDGSKRRTIRRRRIASLNSTPPVCGGRMDS